MDLRKSLIIVVASCFFSGVLMVDCIADTPDTIKIGVYLPMTGPMASQGKAEYDGIRIANRIKPEARGKAIELVLVDVMAEDTSAGTTGAVTRLIEENNVCALIGEMSGSDPLGGLAIAEKEKRPTVIPTYTELATTKDRKYAFRVCLSNSLQGEVAARYAYSNLKTRKAAVLMTIDKDYSLELADIFVKNFTLMGGAIVALAYCQTADTDFITQLSSIMAAKPDVLYLPDSHAKVALICRQSVDMGVNTHMLSSSTIHLPEFLTLGGEYVEGITFTGDFDKGNASSDISRSYIDAYEKETGGKAGRFDVLAADAYFLLIDAIERAQSTKGSDIREALGGTRGFRGVSGIMDMDADGNAVKDALILCVKDGEFRYVETLAFGEQKEAEVQDKKN